ncbi:bacterioferritin-associated ferredoxin [Aliidiomarina maris]
MITIRIHAVIYPMYVCLCKAVTDKDIHRAVSQGACSMRCLRQLNGVGSQCGRCVGHAKEVLGEALSTQAAETGNHSGTNSAAPANPVTIASGNGVGVCYP